MQHADRRQFLRQSVLAAGVATSVVPAAFASGNENPLTVGIIGCGRLGQQYAEVFRALADTELVAIAEWNPDRRSVVGERFGVNALFRDADQMLAKVVPDLACIVTPTKHMKGAVMACAEAGVKGIQTDRPFAARLSDADEMIEACHKHGAVLAGGVMERALWEVDQLGKKLASGDFGAPLGAAVHAFQGEICSGGAARLLVLQHFTQAQAAEITAWGSPPEKLADSETDYGLSINGRIRMTSGLECQLFGTPSQRPHLGVEVWTEDALLRWDRHGSPMTQAFRGLDNKGARQEIDPGYHEWPWLATGKELESLLASLGMKGTERFNVLAPVTDFIDAVRNGVTPRITGETQRHALEIAIACKYSAQRGSVPVKLPLDDRSLELRPRPYRWVGGDVSGRPQSAAEAAGKKQ